VARIPTLRDAASLRDGRWYRLHPLTPVLRGGVVAAGLIGVSFAALWETLVLRVILWTLGIDEAEQPEVDVVGGVIDSVSNFSLALLVVTIVLGLVIWLQWRVHMVRMDSEVIELKRGIVFRSSRRARRDRVNAIGIRRPLIPRLLGLAKLDIQAAGSGANVVFAYLPVRTAIEVRREILEETGSIPEQTTATEVAQRVVEVPLLRYVASLVVSIETVLMLGALAFAVFVGARSEDLVAWLGVVIVLFVYVSYLADRFFRVGSFVIDTVEGDIRVSLGLLATSVETIPPHRFHALEVSQPWPWRFFGWWRIDANLASTPGSANKKSLATTVIAPVVTTEEMLRIVRLCMPGLAAEDSADMIRSGIMLSNERWRELHADGHYAVDSPRRARYLLPLSWWVNRAWRYGPALYLRSGTWIRRLVIVPLARVQSSSVDRGPVHDWLALGAFSIHGVSGPVSTRVLALDSEQALEWWGSVARWSVEAVSAFTPVKRPLKRKASSS